MEGSLTRNTRLTVLVMLLVNDSKIVSHLVDFLNKIKGIKLHAAMFQDQHGCYVLYIGVDKFPSKERWLITDMNGFLYIYLQLAERDEYSLPINAPVQNQFSAFVGYNGDEYTVDDLLIAIENRFNMQMPQEWWDCKNVSEVTATDWKR